MLLCSCILGFVQVLFSSPAAVVDAAACSSVHGFNQQPRSFSLYHQLHCNIGLIQASRRKKTVLVGQVRSRLTQCWLAGLNVCIRGCVRIRKSILLDGIIREV